jgi:hypothetical protein
MASAKDLFDKIKGDQVLMAGAVLGGLYILYEVMQGLKAAGSAAASAAGAVAKGADQVATTLTSPVASAIAAVYNAAWQTWDWATNSNMVPSGNVILPNGTTLPLSSVQPVTFNSAYNVGQFAYGGVTYVIPQNPSGPSYDPQGNYHAVDWNTYAASLG